MAYFNNNNNNNNNKIIIIIIIIKIIIIIITRTVRGSDYSPAIELSEQKGKLVTATGDTEKYSEKQAKSG